MGRQVVRLLAVLFLSLLVMTGCDSKSGGSTNGNGDTNPYEGRATLSGEVKFDGLSSSDRSLLSSDSSERVISGRSLFSAPDAQELVVLFVVNEEGELKPTGISCSISGSSYTCPNIADGHTYVVRYLRKVQDGRVLELRTNAAVPKNATSAQAGVDPVTTLVVDAIVRAVQEAISGTRATADLVHEIMESVKSAVESSVRTLVSQGVIAIPSMVAQTTEDLETLAGISSENARVSEVSGSVLSDSNVSTYIGAARSSAQSAMLANMTHAEIIRTIFAQMMDDGGAPEWMVLFLADRYTASLPDSLKTVGSLSESIGDTLFLDLEDGELQWRGWDDNITEGELAALLTEVNTSMQSPSTGGALAKAKEAIVNYHTLRAKENKTEADLKELAHFPVIVGELFPKSFAENMTPDTEFQNLGQAVVYVIYLVDIFAQEAIYDELKDKVPYREALRDFHPFDFNPEFIFIDLGLNSQTAANYPGVFLDHVEIRSERLWMEGSDGEVSALRASFGLSAAAWLFDSPESVTATLTYPKEGGTTGTVDLLLDMDDSDGSWIDVQLEPWAQQEEDVVTDFRSGTYTLRVTVDGEAHTFTLHDVFVLGGVDASPRLTSPRAYPKWYSGIDEEEYQAEWEAFTTSGGPTIFAPNSGEKLERPTFRWEGADLSSLELPENIRAGYRIHLSRFYLPGEAEGDTTDEKMRWCWEQEDWRKCNQEIYNSWWDDRVIFANSFTLPVSLPESSEGEEYHVGVTLVLIDRNTGREVAQGGDSHTSFTVGTPDIPSDETEVTFSAAVQLGQGQSELPQQLKLALIGEKWSEVDGSQVSTIGAVPVDSVGEASLTVSLGEINASLNNREHLSLVLFVDENSNGAFDHWTPDSAGEPVYWADRWIWVERWGDFRISADGGEAGFASLKITSEGENTLSGFKFTLY